MAAQHIGQYVSKDMAFMMKQVPDLRLPSRSLVNNSGQVPQLLWHRHRGIVL